jgi:hypothetical protein
VLRGLWAGLVAAVLAAALSLGLVAAEPAQAAFPCQAVTDHDGVPWKVGTIRESCAESRAIAERIFDFWEDYGFIRNFQLDEWECHLGAQAFAWCEWPTSQISPKRRDSTLRTARTACVAMSVGKSGRGLHRRIWAFGSLIMIMALFPDTPEECGVIIDCRGAASNAQSAGSGGMSHSQELAKPGLPTEAKRSPPEADWTPSTNTATTVPYGVPSGNAYAISTSGPAELF